MKNKIYLILGSLILIFVLGFTFYINRVTELSTPLVKKIPEINGKNLVLNGIGYPGADAVVYIDENFIKDVVIGDDRKFSVSILFKTEGEHAIKIKQHYKNIDSNFSKIQKVFIDLTPPEKDGLKILNNIPKKTKQNSIEILGIYDKFNKYNLFINKKLITSNKNDSVNFKEVVQLKNGLNKILIEAIDKARNRTILKTLDILVDNIKPKYSTYKYSCDELSKKLKKGEEFLCIYVGQWESWRNPAKIPILGWVKGKFKKITVNGKRIIPDENNEVYQRIWLPVPKGINKYKVVAIDEFNNKVSFNLDMTVESVDNYRDKSDEILDRLDDLEYEINY